MLKITLTKSTISETPRNRATVHALGLRKTHRSVLQEDNPVIRGMIHHVKHLLKVEEVEGVTKTRKRQGKKATEGAAPSAPNNGAGVKAEGAAPSAPNKPKRATAKKESAE